MNKLKSILKGNIGNNNNNNSSDSDVIIGFTYVAKLSEIKTNVPFKVNFNGSSIGIYKTEFNGKKKIYALANKCSHQGFPLSSGSIEEVNGKACVGCKAHGMKFDLSSGLSLDNPSAYYQTTYKVKVFNSLVYVSI